MQFLLHIIFIKEKRKFSHHPQMNTHTTHQLILEQVKYKESEKYPLQTLPRVEFRNTHVKQHKLDSLYSGGRSLNLPAGQKL